MGLEGVSGGTGGFSLPPNMTIISYSDEVGQSISNTNLEANPVIFKQWRFNNNVVEGLQLLNFMTDISINAVGRTSAITEEIRFGFIESEDAGATWQNMSFTYNVGVDSAGAYERLGTQTTNAYIIAPSVSDNYRMAIGAWWGGVNALTGDIKNLFAYARIVSPPNVTVTEV